MNGWFLRFRHGCLFIGGVSHERSGMVSMAQWIAHQTSNLGVVGSSPTVDDLFCLYWFFFGKLHYYRITLGQS